MSHPRLGTYVTVDGVELRANSHPSNGRVTVYVRAAHNPLPTHLHEGDEPGLWIGEVPTIACDRVVSITTRAHWQGELCQVMTTTSDGHAVLYHLGPNPAKATEKGFRPLEPGTYARTVPTQDLTNYHEYHADLLFEDHVR